MELALIESVSKSTVGPNGKVEKVSIVMPTYNRLAYLKEALASVMEQTWTDWELVISDDGSTDGTREYLKSLTDPRIKVFLQPSHLGQFGQFNFLIEKSSSSLVQILCDDDRLFGERSLERLILAWENLPRETGFLRVNHVLDANSSLSRYEKHALPSLISEDKSDLFFGLFGCIAGSITNMSFRKHCAIQAGMFRTDMHIAGDFDFWTRMGRLFPLALCQEEIVWVRMHAGQVFATENNRGEAIAQMRKVVEEIFRNLVQQGYSARTLRLFFTLNYICQHRYTGLRRLVLNRDPRYLKMVQEKFDAANFSVSWWLRWPVFFLSAAGKLGRVALAKHILKMKPKGRPTNPALAAESHS